eukprot:11499-Eustigmatos_ZCMA.PRE.1
MASSTGCTCIVYRTSIPHHEPSMTRASSLDSWSLEYLRCHCVTRRLLLLYRPCHPGRWRCAGIA